MSAALAWAAIAALPPDASSEGWRIDRLFEQVAWLTAGLALIVLAWLAVVLVRDRGGAPSHRHGTSIGARAIAVALTTLAFVAVDGTLWLGSRRAREVGPGGAAAAEREPGAVRVEVDAHQWSWSFRQPGPDGAFGGDDDVVTLDRLVVPRGRAVVLELSSTDVVHALYLPAFRVKADAVPGRVTRAWFRAAVSGRSEVGCAQFCGVAHYQMRGVVEVLEPPAYERWLAAAAADARRIAAEDRRALDEEPSRTADPMWPRWSPIDPATARSWAWPWGRR